MGTPLRGFRFAAMRLRFTHGYNPFTAMRLSAIYPMEMPCLRMADGRERDAFESPVGATGAQAWVE